MVVPGPGLASQNADVSLSLSPQVLTALFACSSCCSIACLRALFLHSCFSLTSAFLVLPSVLPPPAASTSTCRWGETSSSPRYSFTSYASCISWSQLSLSSLPVLL